MKITLYSVAMAVVVSGMLMLLLCIMRRTRYAVQLFGIKTICTLYLLCLVRLLVPVDIFFSESINLPAFFHYPYEMLCINTYRVWGIEFRWLDVFVLLWFTVAGIRILHFVIICFNGKRKLIKECRPSEKNYQPIMKRIEQELGLVFPVKLYITSQVSGPMGMGILDKVILLPDVEYSEEEMYYILLHEYMHFYNKDIAIKLLVHLYSCFFWWNPLAYLLEKDLAQILEMKCDNSVVNRVGEGKSADYLTAIIAVLKKKPKEPHNDVPIKPVTMSLLGNQAVMLTERFSVLIDTQKTKRKRCWSPYVVMTITVMFFFFSYLIVFQCEFEPPISDIITDENTFEVTSEEFYLTLEEDGTYMLRNDSGYADAVSAEHAQIMLRQGFRLQKEY